MRPPGGYGGNLSTANQLAFYHFILDRGLI